MKRLLAVLFWSFATFAAEPKRVVILGDSLAAGLGVDTDESYPAVLQTKVQEAGLPFTIVNAGVSGDTTAGGLRRIDWVLRQPIDVLVVELGGNDGLRGIAPGETRTNLQRIVERARAKYPQAAILIAGMKMPANMGPEYTSEFEKVFADVAKNNGAALIPFLLEGVGGSAKLNQPDRIHPTAEGHKIVAATVWKILEPVLMGRTGTNTPGAKPKNQ
jgi:acyl-CoA thioesterase I